MSATPRTHRVELAASEARLLAMLDQPESWAHAPASLPGWSRNHVVAHLLGNLEGMINLTGWAASGVETPMYSSPKDKKDAIDERATWPLGTLRTAIASSQQEFADACAQLVEPLPERKMRLASGAEAAVWQLPMLRLREVEIHSVDLAAGYTPSDWSVGFSLRTIDQVLPFMLSQREIGVTALIATDTGRAWAATTDGPCLYGLEAQLLAWLIGRPHEGLTTNSHAPAPPAPHWV